MSVKGTKKDGKFVLSPRVCLYMPILLWTQYLAPVGFELVTFCFCHPSNGKRDTGYHTSSNCCIEQANKSVETDFPRAKEGIGYCILKQAMEVKIKSTTLMTLDPIVVLLTKFYPLL